MLGLACADVWVDFSTIERSGRDVEPVLLKYRVSHLTVGSVCGEEAPILLSIILDSFPENNRKPFSLRICAKSNLSIQPHLPVS